jgi:hypothetical protein
MTKTAAKRPCGRRLFLSYQIDTVVPLKKYMHAYQDVMGLTRFATDHDMDDIEKGT